MRELVEGSVTEVTEQGGTPERELARLERNDRSLWILTATLIANLAIVVLALAGCSPRADAPPADQLASSADQSSASSLHCTPAPQVPVAGRASPYDSVTVPLGSDTALLCYGRPSMRGRTIFGGLIPFGELWRTGANEPTILHLPVAAKIAGIPVEAGSYSIYTMPGQTEWTVIVNRSPSGGLAIE